MTLFIISFVATFAFLAAKNSRRKQRQREAIRAVEAIKEAAARQKIAELEERRAAIRQREAERAEEKARKARAAAEKQRTAAELARNQSERLEGLIVSYRQALEAIENELETAKKASRITALTTRKASIEEKLMRLEAQNEKQYTISKA
jgi:hypothetical protein